MERRSVEKGRRKPHLEGAYPLLLVQPGLGLGLDQAQGQGPAAWCVLPHSGGMCAACNAGKRLACACVCVLSRRQGSGSIPAALPFLLHHGMIPKPYAAARGLLPTRNSFSPLPYVVFNLFLVCFSLASPGSHTSHPIIAFIASHVFKQVRVGLVTRNTEASVDAFFGLIGREWQPLFDPVLTREFRFVKPDKRALQHFAQVCRLRTAPRAAGDGRPAPTRSSSGPAGLVGSPAAVLACLPACMHARMQACGALLCPHQGRPAPLPPAVQAWGLPPARLLMVGDSTEDVETGNAAGTATCLIAGGGNELPAPGSGGGGGSDGGAVAVAPPAPPPGAVSPRLLALFK